RNIMYNENFWRFLLPGFLAMITIGLGYAGFLQLASMQSIHDAGSFSGLTTNSHLDAFFNAVNLITFNSSALNVEGNIPLELNISRFTGLLFVLNAFMVAFMLAIGTNNKNLLRFFWWRL